jgi:nucleoside-diphosphate-sugar epimerase
MSSRRSILVTGAGGFIGGRIVEVLMHSERYQVVPGVRRWSSAARIGRHPVQPVMCDLLDRDQVRAALAGVDLVIHCARGDDATTVESTRNLLEEAQAAGIGRVVHLSTIDVYGAPTDGVVAEDHPLVRTGRPYGDSKIETEELCQEFAANGLGVVILRPTIVYGPFSETWVTKYVSRFDQGTWMIPPDRCQGLCNLVYVDDLVRASLLALEAPGVQGEAFNVNGPEIVTWQAYFDRLNGALGYPPLPKASGVRSRAAAHAADPFKKLAKATMARFQEPIMRVYKSSRRARRLMKGVEAMLRKAPSPAEHHMYARTATYPVDKAAERLGFRPSVSVDEGVRLSAQWALHEGVARRRGR